MASPKEHTLQVGATTDELEHIRNFVSHVAEKYGFGEEEVHDIRLAVDEACTNIIKHAYQWTKGHVIRIDTAFNHNELCITIRDNGMPFDPSRYNMPTAREQLENKKRSGYGILLMRKLMDTVEYKKNRSGNILSMTKKR